MYQKLFGLQETVFRTIASRKRLEIIQLLQQRELTVSEITQMLGIKQANVSQHLSELRQAKLVSSRKEATTVYYQLADERIACACNEIKSFIEDTYPLDGQMKTMLHDNEGIFPVAIDPVCHMRISRPYASYAAAHNDTTYYFCGKGCHDTFTQHPDDYALTAVQKEE